MKKWIVASALTLAMLGSAAAAPLVEDSSRGARLDALFQQLKMAISPADAANAETQISKIWSSSGDPAIDRQMDLAVQAMNGGYYPSALRAMNTILVNRPDFVEAWNKRATLYYMVGNYQASLADIDHALALEPRHFGAIAGKGMVMLKLGQQEEALAAFKQALTIDPSLGNLRVQVKMIEDGLDANQTSLGPGFRKTPAETGAVD